MVWKGAEKGEAWDENVNAEWEERVEREGGALRLRLGREGAALRFRERTKTCPDSVQMMIVPSAPSAAS